MQVIESEPFNPAQQRTVERQWLATVRDHHPPTGVRSVVRASWQRCLGAQVRPHLPYAPLVLDENTLETTRERSDWLALAHRAVGQHDGSFGGQGHILAMFDHEGRMLSSEGDPAAREGLAEINFAPGGLWTEHAAGTNGPGTALATGRPVHIVGAEHFCQEWQRWHCAAVPVRDPTTGAVMGVLDISGFREFAHPHSLNLAHALVLAIEQMLIAREAKRRCLALARLTELTARYPGEAMLAVDRAGRVLLASPAASTLPAGTAVRLQETIASLLIESRDPEPRDVVLPLEELPAAGAVWYPVFDGRTPVGGCLLVERPGLAPSPGERALMEVVGSSRTMAEAASRLGITRSTLYRRMERLGLKPERVLRPH